MFYYRVPFLDVDQAGRVLHGLLVAVDLVRIGVGVRGLGSGLESGSGLGSVGLGSGLGLLVDADLVVLDDVTAWRVAGDRRVDLDVRLSGGSGGGGGGSRVAVAVVRLLALARY